MFNLNEKTVAILSGVLNLATAIWFAAIVFKNFPRVGSTIIDVVCCIAVIALAVKFLFNAVQSFKYYDECEEV